MLSYQETFRTIMIGAHMSSYGSIFIKNLIIEFIKINNKNGIKYKHINNSVRTWAFYCREQDQNNRWTHRTHITVKCIWVGSLIKNWSFRINWWLKIERYQYFIKQVNHHCNNEEFDKAIVFCLKIVDQTPNDIDILWQLGIDYYKKKLLRVLLLKHKSIWLSYKDIQ